MAALLMGRTIRIILCITAGILICMVLENVAHAQQWTTNGNDIYSSNSGNVGVGTPSPTSKLDVNGSFRLSGESGVLMQSGVWSWNHTNGDTNGKWVKAGELTLEGSWAGTGEAGVVWNIYPTRPSAGDSVETISIQFGNDGADLATWSYDINHSLVGTDFSIADVKVVRRAGSGTGPNYLSIWVQAKPAWLSPVPWTAQTYGNVVLNSGLLTEYSEIPDSGPTFSRTFVMATVGGKVGIGTTSPDSKLEVANGMTFAPGSNILGALRLSGSYGGGLIFSDTAYAGIWTVDFGHTLAFGTDGSTTGFSSPFGQMVLKEGNVGIGTSSPAARLDVAGDVVVSGNISAKYQDIAEWVPAAKPIAAGTVVIQDSVKPNSVIPSNEAYDTRVAGVVSPNPGLVLGESGEGKVRVATTGRVKVRVDASHAPVHPGDLLVTSTKEGVAMKSEPIDVGGRKIHQPGTLIGKALEPLNSGEGEILVLLSLQ